MEKKRILIVDDEPDLCDIVQFNLEASGMEVQAVYSAEEALALNLSQFDLLLLDVMLPGISGFELAAKLREKPLTAQLPVIFLTARDAEADTLCGFGLGADDYVSKPFSVKELVARVKAVLSRVANRTSVIRHEGLVMDMMRKQATIDGVELMLTRTEFDLLWLMMQHRGKVFTRQQLLEPVWPSDVVVSERTVDVNVTRLRKKMGRYGDCLCTRQGYGYYFKG
ncbi:MAG: response regulator transcription factor [Muribaculaceae bacterium]|nr:response regulator transcription factor [Muribaculaceae bacterium]